jgi:N-acylneuraminate cytidylyltransferase
LCKIDEWPGFRMGSCLSLHPVLAVIPARGGSKGLPGKNIVSFAGLPLIAHSLRMAAMCPDIGRCIVSTDSEEIAQVARRHGGEVPFLRPAELAQDDTPMWPVLQHALREMEQRERGQFGSLLLLQPTSPGRLPQDVARALALLDSDPKAAGVVAVSEPPFNPRWVCVEEVDGYMKQLVPQAKAYVRRQDVPPAYRVNALLYLWKREHVLGQEAPQYYDIPHRLLVVPEERAIDIDGPSDLKLANLLVREGLVSLPWLSQPEGEGQ